MEAFTDQNHRVIYNFAVSRNDRLPGVSVAKQYLGIRRLQISEMYFLCDR